MEWRWRDRLVARGRKAKSGDTISQTGARNCRPEQMISNKEITVKW